MKMYCFVVGLAAVFGYVSCSELFIRDENVAKIYQFVNHGVALTVYDKLFANRDKLNQLNQLSGNCSRSLARMLKALDNDEHWAYRFVDATSKKPTGVMGLTVGVLGDYDECLDTTSVSVDAAAQEFHGKHCSVQVIYSQ